MAERRKRQRTTWQYVMHASDGTGALIAVGWIHNPKSRPYKDTVRLTIQSSDGVKTDQRMTPLEAISIAAGLGLTVQHRGWTGELLASDVHFTPGKNPDDE